MTWLSNYSSFGLNKVSQYRNWPFKLGKLKGVSVFIAYFYIFEYLSSRKEIVEENEMERVFNEVLMLGSNVYEASWADVACATGTNVWRIILFDCAFWYWELMKYYSSDFSTYFSSFSLTT